jgi:hypothetical protein
VIVLGATFTDEEMAKKFRAKRDGWENVGGPDAETRWVGDLGELLVHRYFAKIPLWHWWDAEANKKFDFGLRTLGLESHRVEMKTMSRTVPVAPGFTHSINLKQLEETLCDYWLLASYDMAAHVLTLVGCAPDALMKSFRRYRNGAKVTPTYTVRKQPGGGIANAEYDALIPFETWLQAYVSPVVERVPTHEEHCAGCYEVGDGKKIHPPRNGGPKWR